MGRQNADYSPECSEALLLCYFPCRVFGELEGRLRPSPFSISKGKKGGEILSPKVGLEQEVMERIGKREKQPFPQTGDGV